MPPWDVRRKRPLVVAAISFGVGYVWTIVRAMRRIRVLIATCVPAFGRIVAATFDFRDENGESLSDVARLDIMVTVVDAVNLARDFCSPDFIADRGESLGERDERGAIAHAITTRPALLLDDEPMSGLDLPIRRQVGRGAAPTVRSMRHRPADRVV